jgi:hypothetical protein
VGAVKFDTSALPSHLLREELFVGAVFAAKGGRGTKFWLVVAISEKGATLHVLGLDAAGDVTTASTYGAHAMVGRPLVGRVDLDALQFSIVPVGA